jgi:exo-beta-1,3-glucanase (GH17 family)
MKYSTIAAVLAGVAIAAPHGHHAVHKRDIITATIWETATAPDVVVYVDENGNIISSGGGLTPPTPAPQVAPPAPAPPAPTPAPAAAAAPAPPAPAPPAPAPPAPPAAPPAPAPPAPAPAAPSSKVNSVDTTNSDAASNGADAFQVPASYAVAWSAYTGNEDNSNCKSFQQADNEWSQLGAFNAVRIYGVDCSQVATSLQLAKKYNKKVFLGAFYLDGQLAGDLQSMIAQVNGEWGLVDTIGIGNEDVNKGSASVGQVLDAISLARSTLNGAGYKGPIVHVDTQNAILANPELCSHRAGDYIAANIHAFFNPNTPASQAGEFVAGQVDALRRCGSTSWKRRDVRVRVTETGWPTDGNANGAAVPSKANQQAAIASIKRALGKDVVLFSAFNNYWMRNSAGTFNTEHFWGMFN